MHCYLPSLEPQKIQDSQEVKRIVLKSTIHKTSLYADDLLIYLDQVPTSLPIVLKILKEFGSISGCKINVGKSSILPLKALMNTSNTNHHSGIPIVSHFRYWGIDIYSSLDEIVTRNYRKLFKSITEDLDRCSKLTISLAARISIVKMNLLPRVTFYSSMLQKPPSAGYLNRLQILVSKFILKGQKPRIRTTILQRDNRSGGLKIPNFELYYLSFMLRPLSKWFEELKTPWVQLEKHIISPYTFKDVLFFRLTI